MKTRRLLHVLLAVLFAAALLPQAEVRAAQPVQQTFPAQGQFIPGEVLVSFAGSQPAQTYTAKAQALARGLGAQVAASYGNIALLSFAEDANVGALAAQIEQDAVVAYAQPNYVYGIPEQAEARGGLQALNDPGYGVRVEGGRQFSLSREKLAGMRSMIRQGSGLRTVATFPLEMTASVTNTWGFDRVNADIIWLNANASPVVCVLDSGVDGKHKDLSGRVLNGYDFINDDTVPNDDNGHGTHVAGVISALANKNANSIAGVSNGKLLAVKVLNAQGWGTSFSIAAGVLYCANRADVRVINMSLGGSQSSAIEYAALYQAVVVKQKLVVAAAGNSYSSTYNYPAAWGDASVPPPADLPVDFPDRALNKLAAGLISVGAARINPPTLPVWVDTDGDGIWQSDESYQGEDCAVSFTNYGRHVNLIAPGHLVYSTTPTTYPFWNNYYYGDRAGYEYLSGTSMAAPYVAGAAARVLSLWPDFDNNETIGSLKNWLIDAGKPLNYAVEPQGPGFDVTRAYLENDYNNGVSQTLVGPDGSEVTGIKAPFCWPTSDLSKLPDGTPSTPYTALEDMSAATYLNVAMAMERFAVYAEVNDAWTGLPLADAQVKASNSAGIPLGGAKVSKTNAAAIITNLQMKMVKPDAVITADKYLWVSKSGYTVGAQAYGVYSDQFVPGDWCAGEVCMTVYSSVAVPPAREISAVLNWLPYTGANLDLHLWMPQDADTPGYISAGWLPDYLEYADELNLQQGTLLPPARFGGTKSPYAQLMHDGGMEGFATDILPFDTIAIKAKPGTRLPWYTSSAVTDSYHFLVTDYSNDSYPGQDPDVGFPLPDALDIPNEANPKPAGLNTLYPVLRIWRKGVLPWSSAYPANQISLVFLNRQTSPTCIYDAAVEAGGDKLDWWDAASMNGLIVTPGNRCGNADVTNPNNVIPYWAPD